MLNLQLGFKDWLRDLLLWVPKKLWELFMDAVVSVLEAIPVPGWLSDAGNVLDNIPPGVVYFAQALQLPAGLAILLSAYAIRFVIRRIPVIG